MIRFSLLVLFMTFDPVQCSKLIFIIYYLNENHDPVQCTSYNKVNHKKDRMKIMIIVAND